MKYSRIITFTKFTNLMEYAEEKANRSGKTFTELPDWERKIYTKNKDITLNVYVRYEDNNTYCKIQCPINPLPLKGEFQTPNLYTLKNFLESNGWHEINDVVIPRSIRNDLEF